MIPGFIIAILTFPGVIVHEFAHKFFCDHFGIPILKVCYFRFGNPAGYVIHEEPENVYQHIIISIGPFLINSIVGAIIAFPGALSFLKQGSPSMLGYFLLWLGVSIAMHAFPSIGDARCIWKAVWKRRTPLPARLLGAPIVVLIYLGAIGSAFWLDLVYGVAISMALPYYLVKLAG